MVNRKSVSAEFLQIVSAETFLQKAERMSPISAFLQTVTSFCSKMLFLQKVTVPAERISAKIRFFEEALFLLSAEMAKLSFG